VNWPCALPYVVDDNVYPLNIDTTTENVGGDKDTFFKVFEHLVSVDSGGAKRFD
jgi:hypothetical protein